MTARDMTAANWKRTYTRLQRAIAELREHGCEVREPANFETAPSLRPTGRVRYSFGEQPSSAQHPLL